MINPDLQPVTIDAPDGISEEQLSAMYMGESDFTKTVFANPTPEVEYPYVAVGTKGEEGEDWTQIRVYPPFKKQEPDEYGDFEGCVLPIDESGATVDVYLNKTLTEVPAETLRLCGAAVVRLSEQGGYTGYLQNEVSMTASGNLAETGPLTDEQLLELQTAPNPSILSDPSQAYIPREEYAFRHPDGTAFNMKMTVNVGGETEVTTTYSPEADEAAAAARKAKHPLHSMQIRFDEGTHILMDREDRDGMSVMPEIAHAAAVIALEIDRSVAES